MSNPGFNPAKTPFSRVFLIKGKARADHDPSYEGVMMAGGAQQSFGEPTPIQAPSATAYNQFDEVGETLGSVDRATTSLTGLFPADVLSTMLAIAKARCPLDVQIHIGQCADPRNFNKFQKIVVLEQTYFSDWSTEDLGALQSDQAAKVDETVEVSAARLYEIVPLAVAKYGADTVTNPLVDVIICSSLNCGDCGDEDDGCEKVFAVSRSSPGSPGTGPDVIYSSNGGTVLGSDEITTLSNSQDADGVACLDSYVLVVSNDEGYLHYKAKATILAGTAGGWAEIATGFVAGGNPKDIWGVGSYAFICGDGGYIYGTSDAEVGVTVLDAGVATTEDLKAIHALDDKFAVAVGDSGAIVQTKNRTEWSSVTGPTGISDSFQAVWLKNKDEWFIGSDAGGLYYTVDGGTTWVTKVIPGSLTSVWDITMPTASVVYVSGAAAGPAGKILRSYDSGHSFVVLPEDQGSLPSNDQITALASCPWDPNVVIGVGIADDGSDGVWMRGKGA